MKNHELCKAIIAECIEVINDPEQPEEFKEDVRREMLEIKNEIETIILENS